MERPRVNPSPLRQSRTTSPVTGLHGRLFAASMLAFVGLFVVGLAAILVADVSYAGWRPMGDALRSPAIRAAMWLSVWTSLVTTALGLVFAIPMGYALSRYRFRGHSLVG